MNAKTYPTVVRLWYSGPPDIAVVEITAKTETNVVLENSVTNCATDCDNCVSSDDVDNANQKELMTYHFRHARS